MPDVHAGSGPFEAEAESHWEVIVTRQTKIVLGALALVVLALSCSLSIYLLSPSDESFRIDRSGSSVDVVASCRANWNAMDVEPGDEDAVVALILYIDQTPGTIGSALQECLLDGWKP